MVILIFFHLIIMHFVNDITAITGQFVADRFAATPIWIIIDLAILVLAWIHGLNGLRIVLMDYVKRSDARRIVFGAIGLFGLVWFGAGAAVLVLRAAKRRRDAVNNRDTGDDYDHSPSI